MTPKTLEDHHISHSSLSKLIHSPFQYKMHILSPREEDTSFFRKGAAFDTLLTEPDEFLNRYAVSRTPPPSGMMGEFVKIYLYKCSKNANEEQARIEAYTESGFKLKYESVIKKFESQEIQDYLKFVEETQDKTILSLEEFQEANNMAMHVKSNLYAGKYLLASNPEIQIDYQKKIKFNHKGYEVVSILDVVRIDHANKRITPIDIKSTSKSVSSFESSYLKYGYYRQGALYSLACLSEYKELIDKGYTIDPFRFIVCETSCYNPPIVFQMSDIDLAVGMNGGTSSMGYEYLGINQLIERLQWHQENDLWDYPREVYDSGGTKVLETFN